MVSIAAADLFCGAGGTSTGLLDAAQDLGLMVDLIAINHWDVAIATHTKNHPEVRHRNDDLENVDPHDVVPGGWLKLLVASPECTHFSKARGGKPKNKQSRASIKYVLRWIGTLDVENLLIENVPEFEDWGPLHRSGSNEGKSIKPRKGEYFKHFIAKLRAIGYTVDWRVLNAADYGDATTRKRLFIMARKGRPIDWPKPTHSRNGRNMTGDYATWRPAREVIDWSLKGESIFKRKKPLSPNTLKRIEAGLQKYSGLPFTITTNFQGTNRSRPRSINEPLPTITGSGGGFLVEPFLVQYHGSSHEGGERTASVDRPMPTIAGFNTHGLVQPFIVQMDMGGRLQGMDEPVNTLTSADGRALVEPFIVPVNHGPEARTNSVDAPMPTITGFDALGLAQPFLVMLNGTEAGSIEKSAKSVEDPVPTITGTMHAGLVSPYLVEYHGNGSAVSIEAPLPTQTGADRFGLVEPVVFRDASGQVYMLDILFRMLQPRELAKAMSFPDDYQFQGNREQIVKQIGNAVPRRLAKALCKALLE